MNQESCHERSDSLELWWEERDSDHDEDKDQEQDQVEEDRRIGRKTF